MFCDLVLRLCMGWVFEMPLTLAGLGMLMIRRSRPRVPRNGKISCVVKRRASVPDPSAL